MYAVMKYAWPPLMESRHSFLFSLTPHSLTIHVLQSASIWWVPLLQTSFVSYSEIMAKFHIHQWFLEYNFIYNNLYTEIHVQQFILLGVNFLEYTAMIPVPSSSERNSECRRQGSSSRSTSSSGYRRSYSWLAALPVFVTGGATLVEQKDEYSLFFSLCTWCRWL